MQTLRAPLASLLAFLLMTAAAFSQATTSLPQPLFDLSSTKIQKPRTLNRFHTLEELNREYREIETTNKNDRSPNLDPIRQDVVARLVALHWKIQKLEDTNFEERRSSEWDRPSPSGSPHLQSPGNPHDTKIVVQEDGLKSNEEQARYQFQAGLRELATKVRIAAKVYCRVYFTDQSLVNTIIRDNCPDEKTRSFLEKDFDISKQ